MKSARFTEADLGEMVLRLAHEIRNPLATIKSAVQLLELIQKPQGEIAEFYSSIDTEVARIDRVVRDMYRFVNLGKDVGSRSRIEVAEPVAAAVEAATAGKSSDGARVSIVEGPRVAILINQMQLETAVREMVSNALRFSPEGSPVTVSWRIADGLKDAAVAIDIKDQGFGIANEVKDRILSPFFSTSTHGTGLGLNIVIRVAELAGGTVSWSSPGQGGCRFTLTLPRI